MAAPDTRTSTLRLALMWTLQAQFAGYALARRELPQLALVPRAGGRSAVERVAAGEADVAVASPAQLLMAGEAADGMVLVALFADRSPIVLAARRGGRGEDLARAAGTRIGVWPGEEIEIRAMLRASGVDPDDVELVPLGDTVEPLLDGSVDLMQATTYNEVPLLLAAGLPEDELVLHRPAEHGVDVAKDGLVAPRELLERDPDAVTALVRAALHGWRAAQRDPDAAVAAVRELVPELDAESQRAQLRRYLELVSPDRPLGAPDRSQVERAQRVFALANPGVPVPDVAVDRRPFEAAGG